MGDLSPHFSRHEFACNCGCGFDTVDVATLDVLEQVRTHFGTPVTITSGCRCADYNRRIGGAVHSQHVVARAADIQAAGVDPDTVHDYIASVLGSTGGLGRYNTFTHVDTRTNGPARWDG
tara:strand:- start:554 stop:913 length:360 start_codon:yes stop_codon:yes gene_type:complete